MLIHPSEQSSVDALRGETLLRARLSFCFFVRNVLGLRQFAEERLLELQGGFEPRSKAERSLLLSWLLFRDPKLRTTRDAELPKEVFWLLPRRKAS